MSLLGLLIFGTALGASGISCAKDNYYSKQNTRSVDKYGNVSYMDRKGKQYVNGELVYTTYEYVNGQKVPYYKGLKSGKLYKYPTTDSILESINDKINLERELDENNIKRAKERNKKSAQLYNNKYKQRVTTELSTRKVIACLWTDGKEKYGDGHYLKFYADPNGLFPDDVAKRDIGIAISKEEYWSLYDGDVSTYLPYSCEEARRRIADGTYPKLKYVSDTISEAEKEKVKENGLTIYKCVKEFKSPKPKTERCYPGHIVTCDKEGFLIFKGQRIGNIRTYLKDYFVKMED